MKSNLREMLSAPVLEDSDHTSGMVWVGVVLGILAAVLYSLKAVFVKLAYLPGDGMAEQVPPITLMMLPGLWRARGCFHRRGYNGKF